MENEASNVIAAPPSPETRAGEDSVDQLVQQYGGERIFAYAKYEKKCCVSEKAIRRTLQKQFPKGMNFDRTRYKIGEVVEGTMWPGIYLVVGHGYTGSHGQERGCYGCKITDRIFKRWQWIGADSTLRKFNLLNEPRQESPPGSGGGDKNSNQ